MGAFARLSAGCIEMAGIDALRSLMQLDSPTNVRRVADLGGQAGLDLIGPNADLIPGDDEISQAQSAISGSQMGQKMVRDPNAFDSVRPQMMESTAPVVGVSRHAIQEGAMGTMRRKLGLAQRQHDQQLERVAGPAQMRAESQAAVAEERARSAQERAETNQQGVLERFMAGLTARDQSREDAQKHQAELQAARLAAQGNTGQPPRIPQGLLQGVTKAQEAADGQWGAGLRRKLLGPTAKDKALLGQLEAALQSEGTLNDVNKKVAEAQALGMDANKLLQTMAAQGVPVTAYQERYVKSKMGGQ